MTADALFALIRRTKGLVGKKRQRASNHPLVQDALAALRAQGTKVVPYGDDFQHWQLGDFLMTDADLVHFAVSRGIIADR
ncbi:hypothetical protein MMSR116_17655 [Methylobacterium mesophilicum SR1.6/6]|uniref:Uncharacterized protein n=1 Tax=Methylobacterium mesophilicum SR1.6/6 TaxID=908290 RepID=A0A6B9FNR7_9HYPH|nr:hypothetical protein [Methylobacterium mesophilicum]QGY03509.1 hypothetical protein MMSR116_17655 [Methylobacterium mesophilicum SR1.6/6]